MTPVMIIDRDPMCRRLLELFVQDSGRYTVAASAADFAEAAAVCAEPNVALLLVDDDTLYQTPNIKSHCPHLKIVAMAAQPEYRGLSHARARMADSFWYKEPCAHSLLEVMDKTLCGQSVYPSEDRTAMIGAISAHELTDRELDVLNGVVCGMRDADIANRYDMSLPTVKYHISNIREKTNFSTRTALAVGARKSEFIRGK